MQNDEIDFQNDTTHTNNNWSNYAGLFSLKQMNNKSHNQNSYVSSTK